MSARLFIKNFPVYNKFFTRKFCDAQFSFNNKNLVKYLESIKDEFYILRTRGSLQDTELRRIRQISGIVDTYEKRNCILNNMKPLDDLKNEQDEDMKELVKEEREVYSKLLKELEEILFQELLKVSEENQCSSLIFEINAGVGGQEAMLFADELFEMYSNYILSKGWSLNVLQKDKSDIGGLRYANVVVEGESAYEYLKNEAGVHRVQRVPATEKSGRMHTSTVSVSVIPRSDDIKIELDEKSIKIETKRASGAGGQHVNTTDSAVRIIHIPTGTAVECQSERSQVKNKQIAIEKLKNILYQKQYDSQEASMSAEKKSQIGSKNRNEKIRSYNFTQDRISDHRLKGKTLHNLKEFLNGYQSLDDLIQELLINQRKNALLQIMEKFK